MDARTDTDRTVANELRKRLRANGFMPIPVIGKQPPLERWQTKTETNDAEIELWDKLYSNAASTGLLTRLMPTLDIDIKAPAAAEAVEAFVRERFEKTGKLLVRFGNAPKRAIPFKTGAPFKKITASLTAPDGDIEQKLELLADGQQLVAFGIHPDTQRPYEWFGGEPGAIRHDELPAISEDEAHQLVEDAVELLVREYGYKRGSAGSTRRKRASSRTGQGTRKRDCDHDSPFVAAKVYPPAQREVIVAALALIPSDSYDIWMQVGAALFSELKADGFELFRDWSKRSTKYNAAECEKKWADFSEVTAYSMGTIFFLAGEYEALEGVGVGPGESVGADPDPDPGPGADPGRPGPGPGPDDPGAGPDKGVGADDNDFTVPPSPAPVDLWAKFGPPPLTPGMLPKIIEDYAVTQGRAMGADVAGIAVAAIAVCTAAIPDRIQIQVKKHNTGWLEQPRLWVALVGPPSTMKTPMISAAVRPLMKIDAQLASENSVARAAFDRLPAAVRKQTDKPKQKQLMLQDVTIEAAQEIFKDSPDGLLVYQDELSGFFGGLEKYSGARGSSKDRAFWLQAYNGGIYTAHRIERGAVYIPNLSACILGGIQPEAIRKVVDDCADDGLLQRLSPIILQQAVLGQDEPEADEIFHYAKLIRNMHGLHDREPVTLKFCEAAQKIQRELEAKHLELLACETINRKLSAHIGKYNGIFARLCVVFHCIEHAGSLLPLTIADFTAGRAAAFLHGFLLPHAVAFYAGTLGLSDDHDRLSAVAGYILAHKLERITNRDVQRGDRSMRRLKQSETEAIFEQLDAMGWISREPGFRFGPGRPAAATWIVNPAVHTEFADRAKAEAERRARDKALLAKVFAKK